MKKSYHNLMNENLLFLRNIEEKEKRQDMENSWILKDLFGEEVKTSLEQIKK